MGLGIYNIIRRLTDVTALPAYTHFFFRPEVGQEYGIGFREKLSLLRRIRRNTRKIASATGWLEQLLLVAGILSVPRSLKGDVIECGCFKGGSTASLSLACAMTGRKLIVCDSFEGLPEVADDDVVHVNLYGGRYETYAKGDYCGHLEEVRENVSNFGDLECCEFVKGVFQETLSALDRDFVFVFLDVDLHESLRTCLTALWPRLREGGYLYTHEARQLDYVALFFDKQWWSEGFSCDAPGLIGAGSGLPTGVACGSGVGYTVKRSRDAAITGGLKHIDFSADLARRPS